MSDKMKMGQVGVQCIVNDVILQTANWLPVLFPREMTSSLSVHSKDIASGMTSGHMTSGHVTSGQVTSSGNRRVKDIASDVTSDHVTSGHVISGGNKRVSQFAVYRNTSLNTHVYKDKDG